LIYNEIVMTGFNKKGFKIPNLRFFLKRNPLLHYS